MPVDPTAIRSDARAAARPVPAGRPAPLGTLLSNGRLRSLLTRRGTGSTARGEVALTRWVPDALEDLHGVAIHLRDLDRGRHWVVSGCGVPDDDEARDAFESPGSLTLTHSADGLDTHQTCWVDRDRDAELRTLVIRNSSEAQRSLELTTCIEVVLQSATADASHPVYSKLFVQTEWRPEARALLARRRPRGADEHPPVLLHAFEGPGTLEYESDRAQFLGRGRHPRTPAALDPGVKLSGGVGNVLDPVLALRRTFTLAPGASASFELALLIGDSTAEALAMRDALLASGNPARSRVAAHEAEVARRQRAGVSDAEANAFHALACAMLYGDPALRAPRAAWSRSPASAATLAEIGLEGTAPLVMVDADAPAGANSLATLLRARRYWKSLGLETRLLVLATDSAVIEAAGGVPSNDELVTWSPAALGESQRRVAATCAALHVTGDLPAPAAHAIATRSTTACVASLTASEAPRAGPRADPRNTSGEGAAASALAHFNGIGGFSPAGDYVMRLQHVPGRGLALPPMPWTNVMATPDFGCVVSETGAGVTWSRNSREHRLTPWSNDPQRDPHSEALYLRDDASGHFWSPQPGPAPAPADYEVTHAPGASTWTLTWDGLEHRTAVFVAPHHPARVSRFEVTNQSGRARRLSLFSCTRLVLGGLPGEPGLELDYDSSCEALIARRTLAGTFGDGLTFAALIAAPGSVLRHHDDRASFLGAAGRPERPHVVAAGQGLGDRTPEEFASRQPMEPAALLQSSFELAPDATVICSVVLGESTDRDTLVRTLAALRAPGAIDEQLEEARAAWQRRFEGLQIRTPEPVIDQMVNRWLPYQNLSCRIWGRSAFYQSGGAFGFRDQLQDSSGFVWLEPALARAQIVLNAAHQFIEGDVLHWWHPPTDRGMRTRFADDLLWLPYLASAYVNATGDAGVLDELTPFVSARALEAGEQEAFLQAQTTDITASVYEHAARAIDRSLALGAHQLPLFGCGDWNDGMNRVGHDGRGESVWMAFFLHATIAGFAPHADQRGEPERAARWRAHQKQLEQALEQAGWDGAWYRRGYYDDGTPLGSHASDECRIDALAQAWSVLSSAVPRERAEQAMRSVEEHLVSERDGIIRLLAPPFENTPHDPGYIKGYVKGVRENGGQYTHAALWVVRAMAELGWNHLAARRLAMLSPIHQARDAAAVARYQVEPYVVAADVYGSEPHVGRGGWTWYTGSAGWMYRVAIESVLGMTLEHGEFLRLAPCIPDEWPEANIDWQVPGTHSRYRIRYRNPNRRARAVTAATLDGAPLAIDRGAVRVPLERAPGSHEVVVTLG